MAQKENGQKRKRTEKKMCSICKEEKLVRDFYATTSIIFSDGRVPFCRDCVGQTNVNSIDKVKDILKKMDKPFIDTMWAQSEEKEGNIMLNYMRSISSPKYREYTWDHSSFSGIGMTKIYKKSKVNNIDDIQEIETDDGEKIELNNDIVSKFGNGYSNIEYLQMEKFYKEIEISHSISSPQLRSQVIYLCKLQTQMNRALEKGDTTDFKRCSDAYEKILTSSALAPKDRKSLDEQTGMKNFSLVFAEVEKKGYVEPKPIHEINDIVDRSMMAYINHVRKMVGVESIYELPEDVKEELGDRDA